MYQAYSSVTGLPSASEAPVAVACRTSPSTAVGLGSSCAERISGAVLVMVRGALVTGGPCASPSSGVATQWTSSPTPKAGAASVAVSASREPSTHHSTE